MYYNVKLYAETARDVDGGRLPIFTAAAISLRWAEMKILFDVNMPAVYHSDVVTGLPLFMLSAIGERSDLESTYRLLKEFPSAIFA